MRIGSPQEKSRCESRKRSSRRSCTHSENEGGSRVRAQLSRYALRSQRQRSSGGRGGEGQVLLLRKEDELIKPQS